MLYMYRLVRYMYMYMYRTCTLRVPHIAMHTIERAAAMNEDGKRAIRSIRLRHGKRQLLLTSPEQRVGYDAVGTGQGGLLLSLARWWTCPCRS